MFNFVFRERMFGENPLHILQNLLRSFWFEIAPNVAPALKV